MSVDPILNDYLKGERGMGGVFNPFNLGLYTYTHNNPVKFVDPDGLAPDFSRIDHFISTEVSSQVDNAIPSLGQIYTDAVLTVIPAAGISKGISASNKAGLLNRFGEKIGIFPEKIGAGGKLQPYSRVDGGRYVSPSKTLGNKAHQAAMHPTGQFMTGFSQGQIS